MIDKLISILTFSSGLGCGVIGGVFFAFSAFVMKALARLSPAHGIVAMQSINIVVINPLFFAVFFGTAAGCVFLAISSLFRWQRPGAVYLLIGSLLYLVGTILVTMLFNVPRNNVSEPSIRPAAMALGCGQTTSSVGRRGIMCEQSRPSPPRLCLQLRSVAK